MNDVFDPQEKQTLQTAAYGAVTLVSIAYPGVISTARTNMVGAKVLSGATGLVGEVLAGKVDPKLPKGTTAEVATVVLAALRESVTIMQRRAPQELENYRRMVTLAVEQGAQSGNGAKPATAEMLAKVKGALDGE